MDLKQFPQVLELEGEERNVKPAIRPQSHTNDHCLIGFLRTLVTVPTARSTIPK